MEMDLWISEVQLAKKGLTKRFLVNFLVFWVYFRSFHFLGGIRLDPNRTHFHKGAPVEGKRPSASLFQPEVDPPGVRVAKQRPGYSV